MGREEETQEPLKEKEGKDTISWTSPCCGREVPPQCVVFVLQVVFSVMLTLFCGTMLVLGADCTDKQFYTAGIIANMAYWLPSPRWPREQL